MEESRYTVEIDEQVVYRASQLSVNLVSILLVMDVAV